MSNTSTSQLALNKSTESTCKDIGIENLYEMPFINTTERNQFFHLLSADAASAVVNPANTQSTFVFSDYSVIQNEEVDARIKRVKIDTNKLTKPLQPTDRDRYIQSRKWEGTIESVNQANNCFTAILLDVANEDSQLVAEFDFDEVNSSDINHIQEGAAFYWQIGYIDKFSGRTNVSILSFKLTPSIEQAEVDRIRLASRDLFIKLGLENESSSSTTSSTST